VHLFTHDKIETWLTADEFPPVTTQKLRISILQMAPTATCSEIVIEDVEKP